MIMHLRDSGGLYFFPYFLIMHVKIVKDDSSFTIQFVTVLQTVIQFTQDMLR